MNKDQDFSGIDEHATLIEDGSQIDWDHLKIAIDTEGKPYVPTCKEARAVKMILLLKQMGIKSAESMSLEDACRQYQRVKRAVESTGVAMGPAQLAAKSTQRRRAKQTKRGKR